jgi:hypothetical protein
MQRLADSEEPGVLLSHIAAKAVVAYLDEPLRVIVLRMAESGLTRLPVVQTENGTEKPAGMIRWTTY